MLYLDRDKCEVTRQVYEVGPFYKKLLNLRLALY